MTFDFGFKFDHDIEAMKATRKRIQLPIRLDHCEKRIELISKGKYFNRHVLNFLRTEIDLRDSLKQQIQELYAN